MEQSTSLPLPLRVLLPTPVTLATPSREIRTGLVSVTGLGVGFLHLVQVEVENVDESCVMQINIFYVLVIDCGNLTDPDNGTVNFTTTTSKSTATYNCDTGYILNGDTNRTCQSNGTWSGSSPTCAGRSRKC